MGNISIDTNSVEGRAGELENAGNSLMGRSAAVGAVSSGPQGMFAGSSWDESTVSVAANIEEAFQKSLSANSTLAEAFRTSGSQIRAIANHFADVDRAAANAFDSGFGPLP